MPVKEVVLTKRKKTTGAPLVCLKREPELIDDVKNPKWLELERQRIAKMIWSSGSRVSSELFLRKILSQRIGFLDLFSYHGLALDPRAIAYSKEHPDQQVVNVGLEFMSAGHSINNCHNVNYDALCFLRRVKPNSVGHININHLFDSAPFGDCKERQKMNSIVNYSFQALEPGGVFSFHVTGHSTLNRLERAPFFNEIKEKLTGLGFREVSFPGPNPDGKDFLTRMGRPNEWPYCVSFRVVAIK